MLPLQALASVRANLADISARLTTKTADYNQLSSLHDTSCRDLAAANAALAANKIRIAELEVRRAAFYFLRCVCYGR